MLLREGGQDLLVKTELARHYRKEGMIIQLGLKIELVSRINQLRAANVPTRHREQLESALT